METIRSRSNPLLKRLRAVRRGKEPGLLVLEGARLCAEALRGGLVPELLLVDERRAELLDELAAAAGAPRPPARLVEGALLSPTSALTSSPGVLGLFAAPPPRDPELLASGDALVVVAAGVQDPGNLGALARTAEAAGASALVVCEGGCRPWNEKALRGSMGSLLRLPVLELTAAEAVARLDAAGYRHLAARTRGGRPPSAVDWSGRVALWVSAESGALPAAADLAAGGWEGVTVPLAGGVESLNVTAAAAVLLFAAGRVGGGA